MAEGARWSDGETKFFLFPLLSTSCSIRLKRQRWWEAWLCYTQRAPDVTNRILDPWLSLHLDPPLLSSLCHIVLLFLRCRLAPGCILLLSPPPSKRDVANMCLLLDNTRHNGSFRTAHLSKSIFLSTSFLISPLSFLKLLKHMSPLQRMQTAYQLWSPLHTFPWGKKSYSFSCEHNRPSIPSVFLWHFYFPLVSVW